MVSYQKMYDTVNLQMLKKEKESKQTSVDSIRYTQLKQETLLPSEDTIYQSLKNYSNFDDKLSHLQHELKKLKKITAIITVAGVLFLLLGVTLSSVGLIEYHLKHPINLSQNCKIETFKNHCFYLCTCMCLQHVIPRACSLMKW